MEDQTAISRIKQGDRYGLEILVRRYQDITVKGNPAIYQTQCYDSTNLAYGTECHQVLTWLEGDTQYDIITYFPAMVPEETILAIAESMQ